MKASVGKIKRRFDIKENKADGILNYDLDNSYPERVAALVNASGVAKSCIELYAKFIEGQGFVDKKFYKSVIGKNNLTVDKLLRKQAKDRATFGGFAMHINYNGFYKISDVSYVPFSHCRLSAPDDNGEMGHIAIYDNWDKSKGRFEKTDIDLINIYNPDPEVIAAQVEEAGGFENYKGQVLWYSPTGTYPVAPCDSVIDDVETDARIKTYKLRNVTTGFMASHMLIYKGRFESDVEREDFKAGLTEFQGEENNQKLLLVEAERDEEKPELLPITSNINDRTFEYTERSVRDNIMQAFGQPPVLLGVQVAGKLGTSDEINDAKTFYDEFTQQERIVMEEVYTEIFSRFHVDINFSKDYSIIPISGLKMESGKRILVEILGVDGTQALTAILSNPLLSVNQKVNALILIFGMIQKDAEALVIGNPLPQLNN